MTRPFESETIIFVEKFTSLKQQLEIVWWLNKSTQNFFGGKKIRYHFKQRQSKFLVLSLYLCCFPLLISVS